MAAYASDSDNAAAWYENIGAVEWKSPKPLAVGSRIAFTAQFRGRRLSYTYQVGELVPGERLVMSAAEGPFPMETSYGWEGTAVGGTRMTLRNRGEPAGFSKIAAPVMAGAMRRANRKDLERLKQILERGRSAQRVGDARVPWRTSSMGATLSPVAYDRDLADRIRKLVEGVPALTEKEMFGGLAFLVAGNMAIAASGQGGVLVRVDPAESEALVASAGVRLFEMGGRTMRGWLSVDAAQLENREALAGWVERGVAFARSLPAKR